MCNEHDLVTKYHTIYLASNVGEKFCWISGTALGNKLFLFSDLNTKTEGR